MILPPIPLPVDWRAAGAVPRPISRHAGAALGAFVAFLRPQRLWMCAFCS